MAQAEPSQPTLTVSMSDIARIQDAFDMLENMAKMQEKLFSIMQKLGKNTVKLQEKVLSIMEKLGERERRLDDSCQTIEETQGKVLSIMEQLGEREKLLDDRCQKMEETQCKMLEALNQLSDRLSKENSVRSTPSDSLKQLFASLLRHGETMLAVPKNTQAKVAAIFNGSNRLLPADLILNFTNFRTVGSALKTYLQASQYKDSPIAAQFKDFTIAAAYLLLSFFMVLCYYSAIATWFVELASWVYKPWIMELRWHRAVPYLLSGAIRGFLHSAIPYTLGLGKPFATTVLLFLWLALMRVTAL